MKAPRSIPPCEARINSFIGVRPVQVVYTNAPSWKIDSKFSHSQASLRVNVCSAGLYTDSTANPLPILSICTVLEPNHQDRCFEQRVEAMSQQEASGGQASSDMVEGIQAF
jgi:hypothetical protein